MHTPKHNSDASGATFFLRVFFSLIIWSTWQVEAVYVTSLPKSLQLHSGSSNLESILKKVTKKKIFNGNRHALIRTMLRCVYADYYCQNTALETSTLTLDTQHLPTSLSKKLRKKIKIGPKRVRIMLRSVHANDKCLHAPLETSKLTRVRQHLTT